MVRAIKGHTQGGETDKKTVVARDGGGIREGFELFLRVSTNGLQQMGLRRQPLREGTCGEPRAVWPREEAIDSCCVGSCKGLVGTGPSAWLEII